ncbi:MAG TPA: hypothetical protein VNX86_17870 [Rhizomicrobium sp.]|nr:hypothetical protein [Rhizomicrobium sp.]
MSVHVNAWDRTQGAFVVAAVAALAVYVLALLSPAIFNDGDTYWHIRAGQWMLAHRTVLSADPFSLSFAGKPWETQEWLAEIAMAAAFQALGWSGVAILTGAAMASAAGLLGLYLAKHLDPVPCLVVLILALACVMPDYLARPHILALPFLVAWLIGLADANAQHRAPGWRLLPVMVVWANLHGGFVFGLALIIPFALEAVFADRANAMRTAKNWALFAVAALAATLLNPRGLSGLLYPFELMRLKSLSAIGEWQSPDFHTLNPVEITALAAIFFFIWRGARMSAIRLVVLLALFHLWLEHARYGMLLGIVGAVLVAGPLGAALTRETASSRLWPHRRFAFTSLAAAMLVVALVRVAWPIQRTNEPGSSALAAIPASLAAEPVFNSYAFGGLLIFDGIKPLVDSRADLYGDVFLAEYARTIAADEPAVDALFRKYRVTWTMLAPGDALIAAMDRRKGWHRFYADKYAVIHVADAAAPANRLSAGSP